MYKNALVVALFMVVGIAHGAPVTYTADQVSRVAKAMDLHRSRAQEVLPAIINHSLLVTDLVASTNATRELSANSFSAIQRSAKLTFDALRPTLGFAEAARVVRKLNSRLLPVAMDPQRKLRRYWAHQALRHTLKSSNKCFRSTPEPLDGSIRRGCR
ncbi:MAG: hypothetical protein GKR90_13820 [Pseudomonadales bacterium]|nr:hypothetical protein [Pseudomonadales bacterium]